MMADVSKPRAFGWLTPRWFWVGVALLVSALAMVVWYLFAASSKAVESATPYTDVLSLYAGFAQLVLAVVAFGFDLRKRRTTPDIAGDLDAAADALATNVGREWSTQVGERRLLNPQPLQLHWRVVSRAAGRDGLGGSDADVLVDPTGRRSAASSLVRAFRRRLPRHLVILGGAGAGKSTVAILFTIAALDRPSRKARRGRTGDPPEPVPYLVTIAGWRPAEETLRDFVVRRIAEDYPELTNAAFGKDAPARLFDRGRVLPVLDGLDEMPTAQIGAALRRIGDAGGRRGVPMVITCRTAVYETAARLFGSLPFADVVVLEGADPEDMIGYLTGDAPDTDRWADVVESIRHEPTGPLAGALSTPLMASLARSVYAPESSQPSELCRLADAAAIEAHLLERLMPAAYADAEASRTSELWLSFLAHHLERWGDSPDLAWWKLVVAVPRAVIVVSLAAVWAFVGTLIGAIGQPFFDDRFHNALFGFVAGTAVGVVVGASAARSVGPVAPSRLRPTSTGDTPTSGVRNEKSHVVFGVLAAAARDSLAAMAVVLVGLLIIRGRAFPWTDLSGPIEGVLSAGLAGMAISIVANGLSAGRGLVPNRTKRGALDLTQSLYGGIITALALGVPFSAIVGAVAGVDYGTPVGVRTGLVMVVVVAAAVGIPVAVGRWLRAPVPEQDPLTPTAVLLGDRAALLITSITSGLAAGVASGFFVTVINSLAIEGIPALAPLWSGVICGFLMFGAVFCGSGSPWLSYAIARAWFAFLGHRLPWRLLQFLDDALDKEILRRTGSVYQFRHERFRRYLAMKYAAANGLSERIRSAGGTVDAPSVNAADGQDPVRMPPRWRSFERWSVTAVALGALVAGVAYEAVPSVHAVVDKRLSLRHDEQARILVRAADQRQATDPDTALRLRIAATAVDSDRGSIEDLAAFLRVRVVGPPDVWTRANRVVSAGRFTVTLDTRGVARSWDLDDDSPRPVVVDPRAIDVIAIGDTGWIELLDADRILQGHEAGAAASGHALALGTDVDDVAAVGATGWMVVTSAGAVTAWNLNAPDPTPTVLAQHATTASVIGTHGWVALLDRGVATARFLPSTAAPITLDRGVTSVRTRESDIVEFDKANGSMSSVWDLPDPAAGPVRLDTTAGLMGADPAAASA